MIKIIFSDIDWTLFDHSKHPSRFDKKSINALKKAQKKGVLVFLCTARPYHSVDQIKILDLITPDGLICSNGGIIFYKDEIIYRTKIKEEEFTKLCEVVNKYKGNVEGIRIKDAFIINDNMEDILELFKVYPEEVPPLEDYHHQDVIGCGLYIKEEYDKLIQEKLPFLHYYFRYHPNGVDVSNEIHDKGVAIKIVLDYLSLKKEDAIAFGDDLQDMSMFNEVGTSVAMGNAKEEVKAASNIVTKTVTRHGVKKALKKIIK